MNKSTVQGHTLTREKVEDTSLVRRPRLPLSRSPLILKYQRDLCPTREKVQDTSAGHQECYKEAHLH
jgi:hypothetical protein